MNDDLIIDNSSAKLGTLSRFNDTQFCAILNHSKFFYATSTLSRRKITHEIPPIMSNA
jgi:hypothetical protein